MWIVLILVDSKLFISEGLSKGASDITWICHNTDESFNNIILLQDWKK